MKKNADSSTPHQARRIVFFHPDLGIGGAERLVIDAAVGLQEMGHRVTIFTSHCDPQHCFDEARDGTLDVRVRGNTIFPPTFLNHFHILLAILRQIHLVLAVAFFADELSSLRPDVFIVDQLSACVPLLRWLCSKRQRTLFYCHFPDQLLANRKEGGAKGLLKMVYRIPFDWFEGWSTAASDRIVVNSNFTKSVATKILPAQSSLGVIYPCVGSTTLERQKDAMIQAPLWDGKFDVLLSINRFERKKDIGLALRAYSGLSAAERRSTRLVIAGGYDIRVDENVQYHEELVRTAEKMGFVTATARTVPTALGIPHNVNVLFLLSVPGAFKATLLQNARLLLYTPVNEHFGIVPVEAMQQGLPVLASNTGGPLETIVEGETGWLRDVDKISDWVEVIREVLQTRDQPIVEKMRAAAQKRVQDKFTRSIMAQEFDAEITTMINQERSPFVDGLEIILVMGLIGAALAALIAVVVRARFNGPDRRLSHFATAKRAQTDNDGDMSFFKSTIP